MILCLYKKKEKEKKDQTIDEQEQQLLFDGIKFLLTIEIHTLYTLVQYVDHEDAIVHPHSVVISVVEMMKMVQEQFFLI